jgi:hypothetical protein
LPLLQLPLLRLRRNGSKMVSRTEQRGPKDAPHLTRLKHLVLADQTEGAPGHPFLLTLKLAATEANHLGAHSLGLPYEPL